MSLAHDKLKKKLAGARSGNGWRPRDGENKVLILPPASRFLTALDEVEELAFQYHGHYFKVEGKPADAARCLEDSGLKCPACAMWRAYRKSTDPAMKELAKQISPAQQYLFNMVDINNLTNGVQRWPANWTCWTKVMEVASNEEWGFVYDPESGVQFTVTLTPEGKSKTGFNQYSVNPSPIRISVIEALEATEGWREKLDSLEEGVMETKSVEAMEALLDTMGFPPPTTKSTPATPARAATPVAKPAAVTTAAAVAKPAGAKAATATPAKPAVAAAKPVGVKPAAAKPKPAQVEEVVEEEEPIEGEEPVNTEGPHYDPGPDFEEVVPEDERPVGSPRCFGGFEPKKHRLENGTSACRPCPVQSECQMKMLNIV